MEVVQLFSDFRAWSRTTEDKILQWMNPDLPVEERITKGWFMTGLDEMLYAVAAYAVIVLVGMAIMPKAEPKKAEAEGEEKPKEKKKVDVLADFRAEPIKAFQAIYNLVQVLLCTWMMVAAFIECFQRSDYIFICNKFDTKEKSQFPFVLWVFYLSKILDFTDTFLIVVRRRWAGFSFLHIYHHFSIFMFYWVNINVAYSGDAYFPVIANSFIHAVMYLYYFLTTFGISIGGPIVTKLQQVQFVCMMSQAGYMLFNSCAFPPRITRLYFFYIFSLLVLFAQFDMARWGSKKGKKDKKDESGNAASANAVDDKKSN